MSIFKFSVNIGDVADPIAVEEWCRNHPGFVGVVVTDVTDVSYVYDTIYTYGFENQEAANWFTLRWK